MSNPLAQDRSGTAPTDASRLPVLPGSGERDRLREENIPLPERELGPGPLNAPSQAAKRGQSL